MTLWLCLHLPKLPLDALHTTQPEAARAVIDARQHLLTLSAQAEAAGLVPGMLSSAALAVLPDLCCLPRQLEQEQEALHSLACSCLQFTSRISLLPPQDLLLEIGASLKLFKSLAMLRQRIEQSVAAQGYQLQCGVAPTPRGAQLLARAQLSSAAMSLQELRALAEPLAVECLGWERKTLQRIRAVGVRSIGECLALPAAGFRKRYGADKCQDLDRLFGKAPDPQVAFQPALSFRRGLELLSECSNSASLMPGFERLFQGLEAELRGRDCALMRIDIALKHAHGADSHFSLGLQSPSRDASYWLLLLHEHFQRMALSAPVRAIEVGCREFAEMARPQTQLWQQVDAEQRQQLWERLAARLGADALRALSTHASHVPELASREVAPAQGGDEIHDGRPRPLWLLDTAEPIKPTYLQDFSEPERLETGWWEQACRRDYYQVRNRQGQRLWVYREHTGPRQWFLQGFFG